MVRDMCAVWILMCIEGPPTPMHTLTASPSARINPTKLRAVLLLINWVSSVWLVMQGWGSLCPCVHMRGVVYCIL